MEDERIVALFWERSEAALSESRAKYGSYLRALAFRILRSFPDAEETENDALFLAWNAIPPHKPQDLKAFLGKICRQSAIDRYRAKNRDKRGGGEVPLALEELGEIASGSDSPTDRVALSEALNAFLTDLSPEARRVFLKRYWYFCSVSAIARETGKSESAVKMSLSRSRAALREYLLKEGFEL